MHFARKFVVKIFKNSRIETAAQIAGFGHTGPIVFFSFVKPVFKVAKIAEIINSHWHVKTGGKVCNGSS